MRGSAGRPAWTVVAARGVAVVAAALAIVAARIGLSAQGTSERFAFERPVTVGAPGPHRLPLDLALLTSAKPFTVVTRGEVQIAEGGLGDLRFFDALNAPVPYLLVHPPPSQPAWLPAALLPVAPTKTTSGFEADLGSSSLVDMVRVEGLPAPFLKRLVVEGSGDRERWVVLVAEGTLFDLTEERLRQTALGFSPGSFRYLRVIWNDTNSGRVPLPRVVLARRASDVPPPPVTTLELGFDRRPSEPGRSRYRVRLPAPRLPLIALEIDAAGGHVYRPATVSESRFSGTEAVPARLGQEMLTRVLRDGITAGALRVPITMPSEPELDLVIEDGGNAPLDVRRVLAVLAQLPWVYFEAPGTSIVARYGNRALEAPTYDLEAVRADVSVATVPVAAWGEPRVLVEAGQTPGASPLPEAGSAIETAGFRYMRPIGDARPGLVALVLDAAALAHSRGPSARFADVRILDPSSRQIPYLIERRDEPLSLEVGVEPGAQPRSSELTRERRGRRSIYALTLPYARIPGAKLVLETPARVFDRVVQVGMERAPDRRHRTTWFEVVAGSAWRHADQQTPAPPLSLDVGSVDQTDLLLVVEEGDNAALPIASARLLLGGYRLRFFHPEQASLRLAYGQDDLQQPRYDLALLAPQVMGAAAREVSAGPEQPRGERDAGAEALLAPRTFWILLGIAVVALLALIVRLVRAQ